MNFKYIADMTCNY